eukprot:3267541-Pyramimonas_sp.AAC.1
MNSVPRHSLTNDMRAYCKKRPEAEPPTPRLDPQARRRSRGRTHRRNNHIRCRCQGGTASP